MSPSPSPARLLRVASALLYALSSLLIVVVNKTVLTSYRFPSYTFLGISQMAVTIVLLYAGKAKHIVHFQDFDKTIFYKIFPLPLLYVGNHLTGLASTKKLSLPMFTVLRKFTILMTMVLESRILRKKFPKRLVCSVFAIVFGAAVAAGSDLAFDAEVYAIILLNDVFTACSGVYTKKKLSAEGLGQYGVLFYNAVIIIIPTLLMSALTGDLLNAFAFEGWSNLNFIFYFLMSSVMGFVLMYSIVACSHYNSALTTAVVGAIKHGWWACVLISDVQRLRLTGKPHKSQRGQGSDDHRCGTWCLQTGPDTLTLKHPASGSHKCTVFYHYL
ncbi:UDP-N-acetylglucosamine/UDP-glucose/GDP-mannose transporter isoform X2 [Denticeps clupeoides]|uniref:UDP-N-acetylglucosamine/UDP-glucose/GDP-mannose transporter isoform X2 n=1 Tax=Denticeps clupeoides TaxID=299321 RepID=UPI0010A4AE3F|nr:UDP-N-acetylglucosamine/UDP-glucose/GDP-mannose transporter-like isoform X2 [Denticeps clupeoides]